MLRTVSRYASTTAARRPMLKLTGLSGTYATSLFNVSLESNSVQATSKTLDRLDALIKGDAVLKGALDNPSLSLDDRILLVKDIEQHLKTANNNNNNSNTSSSTKNTANFLHLLAENNRLNVLPDIFKDFNKLNDNFNGVVNVNLMTTQPLNEKSVNRIIKAIENSKLIDKANNESIKLNTVINPEIKGGLVLEIDDKTIDLSIATKIQKLNSILNEDL